MTIRTSLVEDLCVYSGNDRKTVLRQMASADQSAADRWLSGDREGFYEKHADYIYGLTHWHVNFEYRLQWTGQIVAFAKKAGVHTALDYGCGIGTDGLSLAEAGVDVDLYDVCKASLDYARWKIEKHELSACRIVDELRSGYDLGVCIDVIGHAADPTNTLLLLAERCRYLFYTQDFDIGVPAYPMHSKKPERWDKYFNALFEPVGDYTYRSRIYAPTVMLLPQTRSDAIGGVHRHAWQVGTELRKRGCVVHNDRNQPADIVHCHALEAHPLIDVYTNHGYYGRNEVRHKSLHQRMLLDIAAAKKTISVAEWTTGLYREDLNVDPMVIPNGISISEMASVARGAYRKSAGIGDYYLWAKSGANHVCDPTTAQWLATMMPDRQFVFTQIHGTPSSNILLAGVLPYAKMLQCLADARVLIATTLENFSIQTLEAMSLGVPVLAFDEGGNAEAVIHKKTGYLARPGDLDDLIRGAEWCWKHAEELRDGAMKHATQYDWCHIVNGILGVYRGIILERAQRALLPKCSVVITCYNQAEEIGAAIDSALAQRFDDFEVIVVDDGSTDGSGDLIRRCYGDKIALLCQPNAGVSAARNAGVQLANGEFVTCLDGDDMLEPNFLSTLYPVVSSDNGYAVAYSDFITFGAKNGHVQMSDWDRDTIITQNQVPCCNVFRKEAWRRAGGYKQAGWEDWELWVAMGELGYRLQRVAKPLWKYRITPQEGRSFGYRDKTPEMLNEFRVLHPVQPTVSVIIPCYMQSQYLVDSIGSVARQSIKDAEIIVVADGDDTVHDAVIDASKKLGREIFYLSHDENRGLAAARNSGVRASHGRYICCLDADDMIKPQYLEECVRLLEDRSDVGIAYCDVETFGAVSAIHELPEYDFDLLLKKNLLHCTAVYRRIIFDKVGGYNSNMRWGWEDYDFWIGAGERGFCGARIPEPLFMYRRYGDSMIMRAQAHLSEMRKQLGKNHQLVFRGGRPMACCGRSAGRSASTKKQQPASMALAGVQLQQMKYIGHRALNIKGSATGTFYSFVKSETKYVDGRDAEGLLQTKAFVHA